MESDTKAPKYTDRAGDDQDLREELNRAIDRELEKPPEKIDHAKIDSMIGLLDQMDGRGNEKIMERDEFARKYLNGYVNPPKGSPLGRVRAAVVLAAAVLFLGVCNFISVRATSKGIFTNLKEKVYIVYFDVLKNKDREKPSRDRAEEFQEIVDMEENICESWEAAQNAVGTGFKIPQYVPEGMTLQKIHIQQSGESDLGISAQYLDGTYSLRLLIRTISEDGKWLSATDGLEYPPDKKEINALEISFFHSDDAIHAMFQDGDYMYMIETNMEQEILEKVIAEMR